ncbi:SPOR domain-containing protein [Thiomicrorhabdus sediminis]|uniref:SPOR domain-containing protein n=1 Tax=Thiomicrorhabdus sediminis TaxID=2580412 RepID=A0A4P9K536_9GAMM|nr:SPOR domain-containing protein [Thiomicrorhabdus sediminis]QCU90124.1 hypothetical protein FE785_05500 [Thiomicrorhabdus sediminis]
MSLTISELEAERAKILEEIESKAKNLSNSDAADSAQPASLNDWLNAAEEVMPDKANNNRKKTTASYTDKALHSSRPNNRMSFFGVVVLLSLLLTILGVLYIAYNTIHKELQAVMAVKDDNIEQMKLLQADMKSLQQAVAAGGKSDLFISLEDKVSSLQAEVKSLKEQLAKQPVIGADSADQKLDSALPAKNSDQAISTADNNVVTEAILDEKLKNYTQKLEAKIDSKLEKILQFLTNGESTFDGEKPVSSANEKQSVEENLSSEAVKELKDTGEMAIETPEVKDAATPVVSTPLVKLVEEVKSPSMPAAPAAPIANATEDVKWLLAQPKPHYVLQLASMPDVNSLKKIIRSKSLTDTRILPQTRNDLTNYILVTGSFASRDDADRLAKKIKSETGISPWIRKAVDLSQRL